MAERPISPNRSPGLIQVYRELATTECGDAHRIVYARQQGGDIGVAHTFRKKSIKGISTPRHEIDRMRECIKPLKEMLDG